MCALPAEFLSLFYLNTWGLNLKCWVVIEPDAGGKSSPKKTCYDFIHNPKTFLILSYMHLKALISSRWFCVWLNAAVLDICSLQNSHLLSAQEVKEFCICVLLPLQCVAVCFWDSECARLPVCVEILQHVSQAKPQRNACGRTLTAQCFVPVRDLKKKRINVLYVRVCEPVKVCVPSYCLLSLEPFSSDR